MWTWISNLEPKDWAIVIATFVGPIAAVQAQKAVENFRDRVRARKWVFSTLMATRGARLSTDHVRALNSIELTFYPGALTRTRRVDMVLLTIWHEYFKHLDNGPKGTQVTQADVAAWASSGNELFLNLLQQMAKATGYKLSRDQIRGGSYYPQLHTNIEAEQAEMRRLAIEVLAGRQSLGVKPPDSAPR